MRRAVDLFGIFTIAVALLALAAIFFSPRAAANERAVKSPGEASDVAGFGRTITVAAPQVGDILLAGGQLVVRSRVKGDVLTLGTDVEFEEGGFIDGDLVVLGGSLRGFSAARVSGEVVARPRSQTMVATPGSISGWQKPFSFLTIAVEISLLSVWFVATVFISLLFPREVRGGSLEVRASSMHTFLLGLVGFTSFVLTAIVFSYLIPYLIGIPLMMLLGAVAVVAKVFGMMAVFHAVGSIFFAPRTHEEAASRSIFRGDLALAIAGLLVLGAIRLIPVVGPLVWMAASVFGIGAALATRFGQRDPWFLSVRQLRIENQCCPN